MSEHTTPNPSTDEDHATLQAMLNQAKNSGTLESQRETLDAMAREFGTTVESLEQIRRQREQDAGVRIADTQAAIRKNAHDNATNPEDHWSNPNKD